jgi:hypothetical protein
MPSRRRNQARLADPRRPFEQQQRTAPRDRVTQALIDAGESVVSLQKIWPAIHHSHRRRSYRRKIPRSTPAKAGGRPRRGANPAAAILAAERQHAQPAKEDR